MRSPYERGEDETDWGGREMLLWPWQRAEQAGPVCDAKHPLVTTAAKADKAKRMSVR